jgi:hypothetical protein
MTDFKKGDKVRVADALTAPPTHWGASGKAHRFAGSVGIVDSVYMGAVLVRDGGGGAAGAYRPEELELLDDEPDIEQRLTELEAWQGPVHDRLCSHHRAIVRLASHLGLPGTLDELLSTPEPAEEQAAAARSSELQALRELRQSVALFRECGITFGAESGAAERVDAALKALDEIAPLSGEPEPEPHPDTPAPAPSDACQELLRLRAELKAARATTRAATTSLAETINAEHAEPSDSAEVPALAEEWYELPQADRDAVHQFLLGAERPRPREAHLGAADAALAFVSRAVRRHCKLRQELEQERANHVDTLSNWDAFAGEVADALGPDYYRGDGGGFRYDAMVAGIELLHRDLKRVREELEGERAGLGELLREIKPGWHPDGVPMLEHLRRANETHGLCVQILGDLCESVDVDGLCVVADGLGSLGGEDGEAVAEALYRLAKLEDPDDGDDEPAESEPGPKVPSYEALRRLYWRLSAPGGYDILDPGALAYAALSARESVQQLTAEQGVLEARIAELRRQAERIPPQSRR